MSRLVEHKCALSVAITVIERNPSHAPVVVVPGFSIRSHEDSSGTSVNALNFFPCHPDLRLSRLWRRDDGSLVRSHYSGCTARANEPSGDCKQYQLLHRSQYRPLGDDCTWKRAPCCVRLPLRG